MLYNSGMIALTVRRAGLRAGKSQSKTQGIRSDLDYWLSRPVEERLSAVEFLRRQYYGRSSAGLRRVVSVLKRT